jgi:hypothetical protein
MKYWQGLKFTLVFTILMGSIPFRANSLVLDLDLGGAEMAFEQRHKRSYLAFGLGLSSESRNQSLVFFVGGLNNGPEAYELNPVETNNEMLYGARWNIAVNDFIKVGFLGGKVNRQRNEVQPDNEQISGDSVFSGAEIVFFGKKPVQLFLQYLQMGSVENTRLIKNQKVHLEVPETKITAGGLRFELADDNKHNRGSKTESSAGPNLHSFNPTGLAQSAALVLAAAVTLYLPAAGLFYAANGAFVVLTGNGKNPWGRVSYTRTELKRETNSKEIAEQKKIEVGHLTGARMSFGSEDYIIGLGLEGGLLKYSQFEVLQSQVLTDSQFDFTSTYFMAGPRLQTTKARLYLEVLGGSTNDSQLKSITVARMGTNLPLFGNLELGLDLGVLHLNYASDGPFSTNKSSNFIPAGSAQISIVF